MRTIAYFFWVYSLLLFVTAGYDQYRGVTHGPTHFHQRLTKQHDPEDFRHAITCHWFFGCLMLGTGLVAYFIDKGYDKVDPLLPDSDPKIDEELREDELAEMKRRSAEEGGR